MALLLIGQRKLFGDERLERVGEAALVLTNFLSLGRQLPVAGRDRASLLA